MNLEEELNMLNSESTLDTTISTQQNNEVVNQYNTNQTMNNQMNSIDNQMNTMNQVNTMDQMNTMNQMPQQSAVAAQPSMVNPSQAQGQTDNFNFGNFNFDPSQSVYEKNPIERLSGNAGEIFRIHFLPADSKRVTVHYNGEAKTNFVCLKNAYGTASEDCCIKYGDAKPRVIIPVVVMQTVPGQPNNLVPGQAGRLAALVLGPSQFIKLQEQAKFAGADLSSSDIIASVDNPKYKSFNFALSNTSYIQQVPNINELVNVWNNITTGENLCKLAGKLITREEYTLKYSNYDRSKYENKQNTPTSGGTLFDQGQMQYTQGQNFGQSSYSQPSYGQQTYGQQSYTHANNQSSYQYGAQNQNNLDNPWGSY